MLHLAAELVKRENREEGILAVLIMRVARYASFEVRCLCRTNGETEIAADDGVLEMLTDDFGRQVVWALIRQTTLGGL